MRRLRQGGAGRRRLPSDLAQDPVATAASNNPLLKTLTAAVSGKLNTEVNLVDTLNGGEFTVFAPVDEAFAKLPDETVQTLGTPEGAETLTSVLTYHVVTGQLGPDKVAGSHETVNGADVTVAGSGDSITVGEEKANVICGGITTANATVYLIDSVLDAAQLIAVGAIHLIRHGQASWDAEEYDELSERGIRQSALLGMSWEASDWGPTSVVSGSLRRHTQTAIAAIDASGRGEGYDVDAGWNEYDHRPLADRLTLTPSDDPAGVPARARGGAGALDGRTARRHSRVRRLARRSPRLVRASHRGRRTRSGRRGVHLGWADRDGRFAPHHRRRLGVPQKLNDVVVNSSVTTLMVGGTGPRVLTFNDHSHLRAADVPTFR